MQRQTAHTLSPASRKCIPSSFSWVWVDAGKLDLDAPLTAYLPSEQLRGIHVYDGTDYSDQLKIYQLIAQTSGLPDYFEGGIADDLRENRDRAYSVDDVLEIARNTPAVAAPESGKAHYLRRSPKNRWWRTFRRGFLTA